MDRRQIIRRAAFGISALTLSCGGGSPTPEQGPATEAGHSNTFRMPTGIAVSVSPYASLDAALDASDFPSSARSERSEATSLAFAVSELRDHLTLLGIKPTLRTSINQLNVSEVFVVLRRQMIVPLVNYDDLGDEGFAIVPIFGNIFVAANTAVGALYGVYRLLGLIGFAWHDPYETLLPRSSTVQEPRTWQLIHEVPRVRLRGYWVYDADPLPDAFAIWLARNRFNLCGPARSAVQRKLGLHVWGGGHELLQEEFSRSGLFEQHPEWYSIVNGVRRKVASTGIYINPAFGNPGAADYFAARMVERLERGDLKNIDILNVWPSDDRFDLYDKSADATAIGNSTDNLLAFYGRVAKRFKEATETGMLSRVVTLAGISYFKTMEAPSNLAVTKILESANYIHIFYPINRSWSGPVDDPTANRHVNNRFIKILAEWHRIAALNYGIVDYHNASFFAAVALTDLSGTEANLRTFILGNSGLYGSMHPLLRNPGPRRLTNVITAQSLWREQRQQDSTSPTLNTEAGVQEFFNHRYGAFAVAWRDVHQIMSDSVTNAQEMFGINSLYWLLHQDLIWAPDGFYNSSEVVSFIPWFRNGGRLGIPAAYSLLDFEQTEFLGLDISLSMQHSAHTKWDAIMSSVPPGAIRTRMEADVAWFMSTASRYRLMAASCDFAVRSFHGQDVSEARTRAAEEIQFLTHSPTTSDTISPVNQRAFLTLHRTRIGLL